MWTSTCIRMSTLGSLHNSLNLPGSSSYDPGRGHDGLWVRKVCVTVEEARKCVRLPILGTGTVREGVVEAAQEERPASLARV